MYNRPHLKNLFEKEEVTVVKREFRRKYKLNWSRLFSNFLKLMQFWKPVNKRFMMPAIEKNISKDDIAHIKDDLTSRVIKDERV